MNSECKIVSDKKKSNDDFPRLFISSQIFTLVSPSSVFRNFFSKRSWLNRISIKLLKQSNHTVSARDFGGVSVSGFVLLSPQAEDGGLIPDIQLGHAPHQPQIPKWLAPGRRRRERKGWYNICDRWGEVGRKREGNRGQYDPKTRGSWGVLEVAVATPLEPFIVGDWTWGVQTATNKGTRLHLLRQTAGFYHNLFLHTCLYLFLSLFYLSLSSFYSLYSNKFSASPLSLCVCGCVCECKCVRDVMSSPAQDFKEI